MFMLWKKVRYVRILITKKNGVLVNSQKFLEAFCKPILKKISACCKLIVHSLKKLHRTYFAESQYLERTF